MTARAAGDACPGRHAGDFFGGEPLARTDLLELNDTLAGHHCFVQRLTAARPVKSHDLALTLSIVVHRHNLDHLADQLDFARELHADHVELATLPTIDWAAHNRQHLLPTPEQVLRGKSIIARHEAESPREMHIFHCLPGDAQACPRTCLNGGSMSLVAITPDGIALPCAAARDLADLRFPTVREHSLASIWYESEAFRRYRGETELVGHSGGCRCQAWQPGTGVKTTGEAPAETLPAAPWHYRNAKNSMALSESEPVDEDRSTGISSQ
jgi:pyrroloquinoline quinone biosynthesis protein E